MKNSEPKGWILLETLGVGIVNYDDDPIKMATLVKQGTHRYILKPGGCLAVEPLPSEKWIEVS